MWGWAKAAVRGPNRPVEVAHARHAPTTTACRWCRRGGVRRRRRWRRPSSALFDVVASRAVARSAGVAVRPRAKSAVLRSCRAGEHARRRVVCAAASFRRRKRRRRRRRGNRRRSTRSRGVANAAVAGRSSVTVRPWAVPHIRRTHSAGECTRTRVVPVPAAAKRLRWDLGCDKAYDRNTGEGAHDDCDLQHAIELPRVTSSYFELLVTKSCDTSWYKLV